MTDDVKRRYQNDPVFHAAVEMMRSLLRTANLAPSEVREAAMLACIIEEEGRPMVAEIHCTCLSISRDPLCFFHGDRDKTNIVRAYNPEAGEKITP